MDNPFKGLSNGEKAAVGIGAVIVVWFAYKQHQSSSSPSASAIDPLTGLPASQDSQTDPLTGETYLAEAQQYGSVQAAEQALSGAGTGSPYGYGAGYTGNGSGGGLVPSSTVQGTTYGSNAAWAQAVEAGLTDIGYSPTDVAAALGRYLGNLSETSAQATIVQAAIAEYGPPPVGSYRIIMAPPAPPAPRPPIVTQPVPQAIVPDVVSADLVNAQRAIGDEGLKSTVSGPATTKAGEVREVTAQSPAGGTRVSHGTTVHLVYKIANPPAKK